MMFIGMDPPFENEPPDLPSIAAGLTGSRNQIGRERRASHRRRGVPMTNFCARNCDTAVRRYVQDLGCGAGRIVCLECAGSGWWDYAEPEVPGCACNDCKGAGYMLVSIA